MEHMLVCAGLLGYFKDHRAGDGRCGTDGDGQLIDADRIPFGIEYPTFSVDAVWIIWQRQRAGDAVAGAIGIAVADVDAIAEKLPTFWGGEYFLCREGGLV